MKLMKAAALPLALGFAALSAPAYAEDMGDAYSGDWLIRLRGIAVVPNEDDTNFAGGIGIDNSVVPELDITYFFTENFAAELILGTTPHDVDLNGADLGSVWLLPPTLTFQYHFTGIEGFKPYIGAGVNYTIFYGEDDAAAAVRYEDSFGLALQAGVDIEIGDGWYLNADVKRLWLDTDITVNGVDAGSVDIDPWIFGAGVGVRF